MANKTEFQREIEEFEEDLMSMVVEDRNFEFTDSEQRSISDLITGLEKILELIKAKQEINRMKVVVEHINKES